MTDRRAAAVAKSAEKSLLTEPSRLGALIGLVAFLAFWIIVGPPAVSWWAGVVEGAIWTLAGAGVGQYLEDHGPKGIIL